MPAEGEGRDGGRRAAGEPSVTDRVMVTGVGGPAGRAAAAFFRGKGTEVVGADMRAVDAAVDRFRLLPPAVDPAFGPALLDLIAGERARLLVPTVTEELPRVARLGAEVARRGCALVISEPEAAEVANDKLRTAEACARAGLAAPRTLSASARREEILALGLPLVSKPRFGRGGRGVRVHRSADDLAPAGPGEVVWQEFAPGEEFDLNLFVERDGAVAAAVVLRKTALKEGEVGNALSVERADRPDVLDLGVRVCGALRLVGPLDMDIRLRRDGTPALLEVNARLGANALSAPEVLESFFDAWRRGRCD